MKIIIVYKSVSGFTKKYAGWITKELNADIKTQNKVNKNILEKYDLIIYGGCLHAVGVFGLKKIKKIISQLKNKKLIVFSVGASPYKKGILDEIKRNNFSKKENVKFFYLRGGFDFTKLNVINKIIMFLFIKKIKHKKEKTEDEKGMLLAYEKPVDFTKKEKINELVKYVRKIDK